MKNIITMLAALFMTASVFAQSPERMSYQAVIRNSSNTLVTNQSVGMRISILQGSASGTAVYVETQTPSTNANGLVSIQIGAGTVVSGNFTTIDWANGSYFIKTETDPTGGTSYSITGTSQLLSVPYALYAKTSGNGFANGTQNGQMLYWNGTAWVTIPVSANDGATLQLIGGVPTWTGGTSPVPNVTNPTTGEIWMDRNLGATQVATSSADAAAYGDLYQWGRAADGHQIRTSGTTSTLATSNTPGHGDFILSSTSPNDWRNPQNNNLWQGVSGINNPCPSGYRLPTEAEWDAERISWSSNDAAGAFASPLKLSVAGTRLTDGTLIGVGSSGFYWSSTVGGTNTIYLFFGASNNAGMPSTTRAHGCSVRCIKD